jgi:hypothetical protein
MSLVDRGARRQAGKYRVALSTQSHLKMPGIKFTNLQRILLRSTI